MSQLVCWVQELLPERPVAALAAGRQVTVVRLHDDRVYAVGMWDPYSRANVMARGLIGSRLVDGEEVPVIFSPMYKQAFDLRTGVSLSDPEVSLGSWSAWCANDQVFVGDCVADELPRREVLAAAG